MAIDNWVIGKIASTHDENDVVTVYTGAIDNIGLNGQQSKSFSFRLKEWEFDTLHRVAHVNRHVKRNKGDMFGNYASGYDEFYCGEEHYVCDVFEFDTYEEASKFALNMEPNDVIAYEKNERCNSLDICIYKRVHSGPCEEWKLEGEIAWVGNNIVDKYL